MKRSKIYYSRSDTAFIYVRISREDELEGESYSLSNQIKLLTKIAKEKGYTNIVVFKDDGISGVTMNRPDFNRMIEELEKGKAAAVFVKDLSRLGRNYIEVGRLIEEFFPLHNIRLIAVSENLDTQDGENDLTPIRNLFNEWYARDISRKLRLSYKARGAAGIPISPPPYGYIKDPEDPHHWVVDPEAALVVKSVFDYTVEGKGVEEIAIILTRQKILTPVEYAKQKGIRKAGGKGNQVTTDPYCWNNSTIRDILARQEYCGDVVNFKSYSISYKNKKRYANDPENILVFRDVHEPIIDRATFELVQKRQGKQRKRKTVDGEHNMFSGLLTCPECGNNLNYHFNQQNPEIRYFNCPGYNRGSRKICSATHYIRVDFLEQVVLGEIRRLTRFACHHEEEFTQVVSEFSRKNLDQLLVARQSEMKSLLARDKELDKLFERLYEDNVSGKISDERFRKMSAKYEEEQAEIQRKAGLLNRMLEDLSGRSTTAESFVNAVRKYTRVRKLTPRMLNELIDHIEVYHAEKQQNCRKQRIVIHYNCIGAIEIPSHADLPIPDVSMNIRQGVLLQYQPDPTPAAG